MSNRSPTLLTVVLVLGAYLAGYDMVETAFEAAGAFQFIKRIALRAALGQARLYAPRN